MQTSSKNSTQKYKDWNSKTGKWRRKCPVCDCSFEGRKNQKYCCSACKARYNNDKNSKVPFELKFDFNPLEPVAQPEPKKKCRKCADGGSYIDKEGTFKWCECEVGKTITNGLYLGLLKCSLNRKKEPKLKCETCEGTGVIIKRHHPNIDCPDCDIAELRCGSGNVNAYVLK